MSRLLTILSFLTLSLSQLAEASESQPQTVTVTGRVLPAPALPGQEHTFEGLWVWPRLGYSVLTDPTTTPPWHGFPDAEGIWNRAIPLEADGRFELRLGAGDHILIFGAFGYARVAVSLRVTPAMRRIELEPVQLLWAGLSRLRLRILFPDGTPCAERVVHVTIFEGENEYVTQAVTNDEGYAVLSCRPGSYRVSALADAKGIVPSDVTQVELENGRLSDLLLRMKDFKPDEEWDE